MEVWLQHVSHPINPRCLGCHVTNRTRTKSLGMHLADGVRWSVYQHARHLCSIKSGMSDRKPPRSVWSMDLTFNIETERETDGRWVAEIVDTPGVLAYGASEEEAKAKAYALALRVIADRVEESRSLPKTIKVATSA